MERMSLKHKTFGKWAQGAARSNNPLLKKALADSHLIGKELRKKMERIDGNSDDEDEVLALLLWHLTFVEDLLVVIERQRERLWFW